ncbi:CYTH domain-containing protein [Dactylosporangium sp. NPDC051485]|uniref:class IV adenylate cyclase n=1 Tax=Dactylosporangium sp. NPDC051485 TaxID=3154846 RepID=UPI003416D659
MPAEYEAKVLDIAPAAMAELIRSKGGEAVGGPTLQRRYVYDISPDDQRKWIRLRDNGTKTTLAVKQIIHDGIDGTHEVEVTVDGLDATNELLGFLGFHPKSYQENRRTSFVLQGARLEIDEWPMIPPYLEIEADSPEEVRRIATVLGYDEQHLTSENTTKVYQRYGIELSEHQLVSFT